MILAFALLALTPDDTAYDQAVYQRMTKQGEVILALKPEHAQEPAFARLQADYHTANLQWTKYVMYDDRSRKHLEQQIERVDRELQYFHLEADSQ